MMYTHGIFARVALADADPLGGNPSGFAYRLQKREDPPPFGAGAFPTTTIGPVKLYRSLKVSRSAQATS